MMVENFCTSNSIRSHILYSITLFFLYGNVWRRVCIGYVSVQHTFLCSICGKYLNIWLPLNNIAGVTYIYIQHYTSLNERTLLVNTVPYNTFSRTCFFFCWNYNRINVFIDEVIHSTSSLTHFIPILRKKRVVYIMQAGDS